MDLQISELHFCLHLSKMLCCDISILMSLVPPSSGLYFEMFGTHVDVHMTSQRRKLPLTSLYHENLNSEVLVTFF